MFNCIVCIYRKSVILACSKRVNFLSRSTLSSNNITCSKDDYKSTSDTLIVVALQHCLYVVYIVNFKHIECNVQYIFQFRQICVATTQINLTIKQIFSTCQPLSTPHSLSPAPTHNSIYHLYKTINFLNKCPPNFGIWKSQIRLELTDSRDIDWENFELRKSRLGYSIFVSFFVLIVCKIMVRFSLEFGSRWGPVFIGCQLVSPKPTMVESLHKDWLIQINEFCCLWNLETVYRI